MTNRYLLKFGSNFIDVYDTLNRYPWPCLTIFSNYPTLFECIVFTLLNHTVNNTHQPRQVVNLIQDLLE